MSSSKPSTTFPAATTPPARDRINGLDSLRFVAAMVVALSHGLAPSLQGVLPNTGIGRVALLVYNNLFCGPAAVVVFFVISGFCIHYSNAAVSAFDWKAFFARRGIRLLIPLLCATVIANLIGGGARTGFNTVNWSLCCELTYYLLYPLLRQAIGRWGVRWVTLAASVAAAPLLILWRVDYYWQYPVYVVWLAGLPAWLAGCWLAQSVAAAAKKEHRSPWAWRAVALATSTILSVTFFHAPVKIGEPILMTPVAVIAYFWLKAELAHYAFAPPQRQLEWCGRWSYSLYLIHPLILNGLWVSDQSWGTWALRAVLTPCAAFGFYFLVEAPAHRLARGISRRIAARDTKRQTNRDAGESASSDQEMATISASVPAMTTPSPTALPSTAWAKGET